MLIILKLLFSSIKEVVSTGIPILKLLMEFLILKEWSPSHSKHHKKKLNQQLEMSPSGIAANVLDSGKTADNSQQQVPTYVFSKKGGYHILLGRAWINDPKRTTARISSNSKFIVVGVKLIHKRKLLFIVYR